MKIENDAILPIYDSKLQYKLYAFNDSIIKENTRQILRTGLKGSFPSNYCAVISFVGDPHGFHGLIDSDYRGEISVIAFSKIKRTIKRGEFIATLTLIEIDTPNIVKNDEELSEESDENTNN